MKTRWHVALLFALPLTQPAFGQATERIRALVDEKVTQANLEPLLQTIQTQLEQVQAALEALERIYQQAHLTYEQEKARLGNVLSNYDFIKRETQGLTQKTEKEREDLEKALRMLLLPSPSEQDPQKRQRGRLWGDLVAVQEALHALAQQLERNIKK